MNLNSYRKIFKNSKKSSIAVYVILRILILFCLIREFFLQNYNNVLLCILSMLLFTLPLFIRGKLKISLPSALEISIYVFIFSAEILGEIENFYGNIPIWDSILHTLNGFLAAAVGFNLIDLLNVRVKEFYLSPVFVAIVAVCFSMTIGIFWEFFEFSVDKILAKDMQKDRIISTISSVTLNEEKKNIPVVVKNIAYTILYDEDGNELQVIEGGYLDLGVIDTMKDLFVNLIGAIIFSVFGYFYITDRDKYKFIEKFQIEPQKKTSQNSEKSNE